jgi:hypothetical protein
LQFLDTVPNRNKFGYDSNKQISESQKKDGQYRCR